MYMYYEVDIEQKYVIKTKWTLYNPLSNKKGGSGLCKNLL